MEALAERVARCGDRFAELVSRQDGIPISMTRRAEAVNLALVLHYYADLIPHVPIEESRPGMYGGSTIVRRDPVGVVAAIVPWNMPQTLLSFKLAPALAAGCAVVVKPSPETVLDALLLAESCWPSPIYLPEWSASSRADVRSAAISSAIPASPQCSPNQHR